MDFIYDFYDQITAHPWLHTVTVGATLLLLAWLADQLT